MGQTGSWLQICLLQGDSRSFVAVELFLTPAAACREASRCANNAGANVAKQSPTRRRDTIVWQLKEGERISCDALDGGTGKADTAMRLDHLRLQGIAEGHFV